MAEVIDLNVMNKDQVEKLQKRWLKDAEHVDTDSLIEFCEKLCGPDRKYIHTYDSYCYAVAACCVATMVSYGFELSGYQASVVPLIFLLTSNYRNSETGIVVRDWDDMLYPQCAHKFEKTIPQHTFDVLQETAKTRLKEALNSDLPLHTDVLKHWVSIISGEVPFGYTIEDVDD